ncbi:hypothetical protein [Marinobacter sp.]|uniref:hypothetical protein n=1 Tax=Marinobacter sp. TaxID=50741 RepID=UPI002627B0AA|nr:hypothetical protein [Marinobacter sp.]
MKASLEKLEVSNINCIPLPTLTLVASRMKRLVDFALQANKLKLLLEHIEFARVYCIRDKYYFSEHYFLFAELASRSLPIALEFVVVPLKRSVTLAQLREKILHQIEVESLITTDAKVAYALSYSFDSNAPLFRQVDYTKILKCHRRALRHKDKLFEKTEVPLNDKTSPIDVDQVLHDVPVLKGANNG